MRTKRSSNSVNQLPNDVGWFSIRKCYGLLPYDAVLTLTALVRSSNSVRSVRVTTRAVLYPRPSTTSSLKCIQTPAPTREGELIVLYSTVSAAALNRSVRGPQPFKKLLEREPVPKLFEVLHPPIPPLWKGSTAAVTAGEAQGSARSRRWQVWARQGWAGAPSAEPLSRHTGTFTHPQPNTE